METNRIPSDYRGKDNTPSSRKEETDLSKKKEAFKLWKQINFGNAFKLFFWVGVSLILIFLGVYVWHLLIPQRGWLCPNQLNVIRDTITGSFIGATLSGMGKSVVSDWQETTSS